MSSGLADGAENPSSQDEASQTLASRLIKDLADWIQRLEPQTDSDGWEWTLQQGSFESKFEGGVLALVNRPGDAMTRQRLEQQYGTTDQAVADMDQQCTNEGLWSKDEATRTDAWMAAQDSICDVRAQIHRLSKLIREGFAAEAAQSKPPAGTGESGADTTAQSRADDGEGSDDVGRAESEHVWRPIANGWAVGFGPEREIVAGRLLGMGYIRVLLENPNMSFAARRLERCARPVPGGRATPDSDVVAADGLTVTASEGDLGPLDDFDMKQVREIREGLQRKLARETDPAEQAAIAEELEEIDKYVKNSKNLWGGQRDASSPYEKRRKRVRKAITKALEVVGGTKCSRLWEHLDASIDMRGLFTYRPQTPVPWEFD